MKGDVFFFMKKRSIYSRSFNNKCNGWTNSRKLNKYFLRLVECYFNDILRCRGYVYLKDVYEYLGIPLDAESYDVGWIYDEKNPIGDNFIDFGLSYEFEYRGHANIILDFNVVEDIGKLFKERA